MNVASFLTDLRPLVTVLSFVAFIAIVVWAWSARRNSDFNEAANLPFADEPAESNNAGAKNG